MPRYDIQLKQYEIDLLLSVQSEEWELLRNNFETYDNALSGEIYFEKVFWKVDKILLNYRKTSLSADLAAIDRGERPCFLCRHARPTEQKAVEWEDYEILANPYPASDIHYTIASREHIPQSIVGKVKDMARLTRVMPDCCIFYNGPKCGASAPDHMHFQAVYIEEAYNFMLKPEFLNEICRIGKGRIYTPLKNMMAFGFMIIDTQSDKELLPLFETVLHSLPVNPGESEPMMNVVAFKFGGHTRVVVIPRKHHRPLCYGSGEGQMLVSPASLEMMGKFITSRQEDYNRLDESVMQEIYNEVGYTPEEFNGIIAQLQS